MPDQKISDLDSGSLGASDYTIIQRGTDNYRFLIRDAIDARIYSLAALSSHGHTVATSSVSGFMSAADKTKLDSIASGATASGASGDAYAVSHEADTTAHTAANIVNVPAGNISATTVQAALNELDTEKQPLDASLTALAALTTAADKFIYFTGPDVPVAGTVTAFARTFLDDTSGSGVLATLSGVSSGELSYGGFGAVDYGKVARYGLNGALSVSDRISIFNPSATRFAEIRYLSNAGDYEIFIPGTATENDAYFVVVPATAQTGDLMYWGGTGVGGVATNGPSGYVLISNGSGNPPTWGQVSGSGGGISDGDKGDITVSSAGAVWTIDSGLNAAKIADGSVSNTEFQYLDGVTSNIQTQLGNKQPLDATLTALAALTTAADTFIYFTGSDAPITGSVTAAARSVLDDVTTNDILVTLGGDAAEGTGGIVRKLSPNLLNPSISGSVTIYKSEIAPTDANAGVIWVEDASPTKLVYKDSAGTDDYVVLLTQSQSLTNKVINGVTLETGGSTSEFLNRFGTYSTPAGGGSGTLTDGDKGDITVTSSGAVWTIDSGLSATKIADGSVSNTEFQYLDGVTSNIQTQLGNKQPLDATLTALAALTTAADRFIYFTGADTPVTGEVTAFARSILDDTSGSGVLATISGVSSGQLSFGGFGTSDNGKIPMFTGDGSLNISNTLYIHSESGYASITYPAYNNVNNIVIPNTSLPNDTYLMTLDSIESNYGDLIYWGGQQTGCVATIGPSGHVLKSNGTGNAPTWEPVTGWYANIYSVDVLDATSEYYSASDEQKVVKFGSSGSLAIYSDNPHFHLLTIENFGCSSYNAANIYSSTELTGSVSIYGTSNFGYGIYGFARSVYGTAIKAVAISTGVAIELSNNSFSTKLSTLATSDHFVKFPDKSGIIAMLSDIAGSGGVSDGDKGDITVSSAGSVWTIDSGLSAAKIADGSVSNTEFQYLDGVTSNIQTQLGNKQPLDATLTALAAYNTNGVLVQTSADTFTGRTITGTSNEITVTNGDGVAGNPTLSLSTGINPTKLADGSVSATEFQYLDGVTSNIQTQFSNKQPLDATLTALASYNTNGLLAQTAADTFAGRTVTAGQGISVSNGDGVAGNPTIALNTNALRGEISFRIDGGGSAITTGAKKIYLRVGYDCTITGWELVADQSGSISIDIWKDSFANFPPTVADTITAAAKPSLSAAQKNNSSSLTGWTTSVSAGDYLEINVDSASTITLAILTLLVTRT